MSLPTIVNFDFSPFAWFGLELFQCVLAFPIRTLMPWVEFFITISSTNTKGIQVAIMKAVHAFGFLHPKTKQPSRTRLNSSSVGH